MKKADEERLRHQVDVLWDWARKHDDHFHVDEQPITEGYVGLATRHEQEKVQDTASVNVTGLCKCRQIMLYGGDEERGGMRHTWDECYTFTENRPSPRTRCACGGWVFLTEWSAGVEQRLDGQVVTHRRDKPCYVGSDEDTPEQTPDNLPRELEALLNRYCAENVSGTPDFILAAYLLDCIKAFNDAVTKRADWRGESTELPALIGLQQPDLEPFKCICPNQACRVHPSDPEPKNDLLEHAKTLQEAVGLAMGHVSMCWEPSPTGVFESTDAAKMVDKLVAWIENNLNPEPVDFNPMSPSREILTFDVLRRGDVSGLSGTGVVAMGAMFPDGAVVVQWQTHVRSVVIFNSMAAALMIHGHKDLTGFRFHDCPSRLYLSSGEYVPLTEEEMAAT